MSWKTEIKRDNAIQANVGNVLIVADQTADLQPKPRGRPFKPGISGNPNGRPKGSRNRLTDQVLKSIAEDFAQHGSEVLERVRREEPATYLKMIVSLLPRELVMQFEQHRPSEVGQLEDEQIIELADAADTQKVAEQVYENRPPIIRRRR